MDKSLYNIKKTAARRERRLWCLNMLGGECVKCASTKRLQFDHIDPKTKVFTIAVHYGKSKKHLLPELKKCQLLCSNCHWEKTREDFSYNKPREELLKPWSELAKTVKTKDGHGVVNMWKYHGCRCDPYKKASNLYQQQARAKNKLKDKLNVEHGTVSAYVYWGCRCRKCMDKHQSIAKKTEHKVYYAYV